VLVDRFGKRQHVIDINYRDLQRIEHGLVQHRHDRLRSADLEQTMKSLRLFASLLTIVLGAVTMVAEQRPMIRPIQPLLGVGDGPAPAATGADAFFDDTVLQEIRLSMNARDWQTLKDNYLDNTYYPTDFRWRDQTLRNVAIRSRGTGSRSGVKPGLRVDFDRYTTNQNFFGLKSFVLRNNTQDSSNMHERLSMLMFRRLGEVASREAHTKLYINDQYSGLFTIVESVDKAFLKRNLGEDSGYLYKYDYPIDGTPYRFEDKGPDPALYVPLPFKPETHEDSPKPEFIVQLVQAVNQSSDSAFRTAVAPYLDLQKFLRHVAVEVFVGDYDGFIGNYGINNFYFYRFDNQKTFLFIPWDKSEAFKAGPTSSVFHNISDVPDSVKNRLMTRALSYPDLYNYFLDTLIACAQSAAESTPGDARGWLEREVQREADQIRDAAHADTEKPYSNESFEAEIQNLLDFARRRSDLVTQEVNGARH
jgi:spore coat protein H